MAKELSKQSYEKLYSQLEKIVHELERGEVELEESLKNYEFGISIYHECSRRLKEAEEKVLQITKNKDGIYETNKIEMDENGGELFK